MKPPGPAPEAPIVTAVLMCRHAWRHPASGEWSLLGVFHRVHAAEGPISLGEFWVYLNFTNLNGVYRLDLEVVRADDELVLAALGEPEVVDVRNPRARVEMALLLSGIRIPAHGYYVLRLYSNDRLLHDVVFSVERQGDGS